MGIDYDGVGGVGLELDYEMISSLGRVEDDDREINDFLEELFEDSEFVKFEYGGNSYNGDYNFYLFVKTSKYSELKEIVPKFIEELSSKGLKIKEEDLEIISDYLVW